MQASPEGRVKASPFFDRRFPRPFAWAQQVSDGSFGGWLTSLVSFASTGESEILASLSDSNSWLIWFLSVGTCWASAASKHSISYGAWALFVANCELKEIILASTVTKATLSVTEVLGGEATEIDSKFIDWLLMLVEDGSDDLSSITVLLSGGIEGARARSGAPTACWATASARELNWASETIFGASLELVRSESIGFAWAAEIRGDLGRVFDGGDFDGDIDGGFGGGILGFFFFIEDGGEVAEPWLRIRRLRRRRWDADGGTVPGYRLCRERKVAVLSTPYWYPKDELQLNWEWMVRLKTWD